jgi:hypothetical protein
MRTSSTPTIYHITVQGQLKEEWAAWLNGMVVEIRNVGDTNITIRVPDQAALRGILNKLWDLNLTLISAILQEDDVNLGEADG